MKLFYSSASPFARKVTITALAAGLDGRIERITTNPWESPPELLAHNPLCKLPCLVTEDGLALFDSPVICEYLDEIGESTLFPPPGPARWRALKQQAVADGIADAGILRRLDEARPAEEARAAAIARQKATMVRGLDLLERTPPADHLDIGTVSVVCALGWVAFRFAADDLWTSRPRLAAWYKQFAARPEVAGSAPK